MELDRTQGNAVYFCMFLKESEEKHREGDTMDFLKKLSVGVCYYPEHWDESLWPSDLERMMKNGIRTVRIGEFGWSIMEKDEGQFDFSFFDRFLDLCSSVGMQVIFGTPSATPPAWLTCRYPETLNANVDGVIYRHGGRRHYNYNSSVYREKVALMVTKMAEHWGSHPAIVGWQIDNELNCETNDFLSKADGEAFRSFLREKYETLDALNAAWGTVFWSQTYTEWEQIDVPHTNAIASHNPSLLLDYVRFVSHSALSFCAMQTEILRQWIEPRMFITTNGMFGRMDNHRMAREILDGYMYDSYPNFAYGIDQTWSAEDLHDRGASMNLIKVRSICPHFGIMEQQSGANGWYNRLEASMPRPGQLKLWAMQSVAHGADYVSFFRWRTSPVGTEIYWHGILDYDSRDNRRLGEVADFAQSLEKLQEVCGAEADARFGVVQTYDNLFDADVDHWHGRVQRASEEGIFEAAQETHTTFDFVDLRDETRVEDLLRYPVLFAPHLVILREAETALLRAYVEAGGVLVVGCRTGYKDTTGKCPMQPMPGLMRELTGTTVEEYTFRSPAEEMAEAEWDGKKLHVDCFMESLKALEGTDVLARYTSSYLKGEPVVTERRLGKGRVLHFGGVFTRQAARRFLKNLKVAEPYEDWVKAPAEVEVVGRVRDGQHWLFLLNYLPEAQEIRLGKKMVSLLSGEEEDGRVEIPPYGVAVYRV